MDDNDQFFAKLANYVYEDKVGRPIGIDGRIRVNFFLDLLTAVHSNSTLQMVSEIFCQKLKESGSLTEQTGIACPKFGNVLFARKVAEILNVKSCFVRENILFGRWLEGNIGTGEKVFLIDDVASDGEMICEAANNLRNSGVYVEKVWVFIDRAEGDAQKHLNEAHIEYGYIYKFSDDDLQKIKHKRFSPS